MCCRMWKVQNEKVNRVGLRHHINICAGIAPLALLHFLWLLISEPKMKMAFLYCNTIL